jgi:hypothetical protein
MHFIATNMRFIPASATVEITTQDGNTLSFNGAINYGKTQTALASLADDIPSITLALSNDNQKAFTFEVNQRTKITSS